MNATALLPALVLLALPAAPGAADVTVFETLPDGSGSVRILDESGLLPERRPAELQGIRLLALDFVGRTSLQERLGQGPQRFDLPDGAARVELPHHRGTLYHFRRGQGSEAVFGWFQVGSDGAAEPLFERPGLGVDGLTDPFATRIGLSGDGRSALVATVVAAGGDAFELDLVSGGVENRTANRPPLAITLNGLALLPEFGALLTPRGPWRFERSPGAQVTRVPFAREAISGVPGSQTDTRTFSADLVCSGDGTTLAVTAGPTPDRLDLYVFRATGRATRVTRTPECITGAGFLPEVTVGPTLALSQDGSHVAWRVDRGTFHDIRVRSTEEDRVAVPTFEATADANFTDTLDDSGVIAFYSPDDLMMVVGEADPAGHIDRGDVFVVRDVGSAFPEIVNVTGTSGDLQAPYLESGRFGTDDGIAILPDGSGAIALVRNDSGDKHVELLDFNTGQSTRLVDLVDHVALFAESQGHVVFSLEREEGNAIHELYHLAPGASNATQLMSLSMTSFDRWATDDQGNFAAILTTPGADYLGGVHLPSLAAETATGLPLRFGPTLRYLPSGDVVTTITTPAQDYAFVWTMQGPDRLLPTGPIKGYVLP